MEINNILFSKRYKVNEHINIEIPTVRDVLENESVYYNIVSIITATPYDLMVHLDEIGIDFTQLSDYDLFLITFNMLKRQDTSMVFGELDVSKFQITPNTDNDEVVLICVETGAIIDRAIYHTICEVMRKIHRLKRNYRAPANKEAQSFMLERAKAKSKRKRKRAEDSRLEDHIIALVNTEQFKYNFDTIRNLSIYQFNESLHQIIKKIDFNNKTQGIYAGTISAKDIKPDELNWLIR